MGGNYMGIDLVVSMWQVLGHLAPWILLGTFIAGLMHVLLPRNFIRRSFRGTRGVFQAVGLGVPLPLCSCGVIPAGIGLKKDGASNGAAVGFLISTPQTSVSSILVSASFLGWPFALFKVFSAAITGIFGGLTVDRWSIGDSQEVAADATPVETETTPRRGWREAAAHGLDIIRSIWHWLLIGVIVSAVIEVLVPQAVFAQLNQWGSFASALAALAISLPLYVCATTSVPVAAAMVAGGLPPGAAMVFLMAGPATNVAAIGAIYRRFGGMTVSVYLATIVVGSILFALTFDWLLVATPIALPDYHEHGVPLWSTGAALVLLALIAWFAFEDLRRLGCKKRAARQGWSPELRIPVQGMNCNNCVMRLEKALRATRGIDSVLVTREPGEAVIRGGVDREQVLETIQSAGFQAQ